MPKLEEDFKRHLQGSRFFTKDDRVVVAVSTGVDSMVLLHLLITLPPALRPQLVVAHVNHHLRVQSDQEERFLRDYCRQFEIKLWVKQWPPTQHPQTGIEAAARKFRYQFFADVMAATGAGYLLTAHHQNDLAETMLMKLVRGGQLNQLVGIRDSRPFAGGHLVRPLLPFPKKRLRAYALAHHLKWYEDRTNQDLTITRNRYRHELIPALERENPQLLDHLSAYHQQLAAVVAWANQQAAHQLATVTNSSGRLLISKWKKLPKIEQRWVLERWLEQLVPEIKQSLLDEIIAMLVRHSRPQQQLALPAGHVLKINYDECFIQASRKIARKPQYDDGTVVELGQWYLVNDQQRIILTAKRPTLRQAKTQEMWVAPAQLPLRLRRWQPGDYLRLRDGGRQKVRRVLIDQKVPNQDRVQQLVLVDQQGVVVWLVGRKWSWFTRPVNYQQCRQRIMVTIQEHKEES